MIRQDVIRGLVALAAVLAAGFAGLRLGGSPHHPFAHQIVVALSGDVASLGIDFPSAEKVEIDEAGRLCVRFGVRAYRLSPPAAHQQIDGTRRGVEVRFEMAPNGTVHLALGKYDRSRPVVIGPLVGSESLDRRPLFER